MNRVRLKMVVLGICESFREYGGVSLEEVRAELIVHMLDLFEICE